MSDNSLGLAGSPSVVVVGGGIIGVTSAINLVKRGFQVTLIEKAEIAAGASTGNCGLMAVGEIVPISKPGVLAQVPGWLMDPSGPVRIRPWHAMTMSTWFFKFLKAGSKENVQRIAQGLTQLSNAAAASYQPLLKEAGIEDLLQPYEVMYLFDDQSEISHGQYDWDLRSSCNFEYEFLTGDQTREAEPEISKDIACSMLMKGWDYFSDPARLTKSLANLFVSLGGNILIGEVRQFEFKDHSMDAVVLATGERIMADHFVIAAGAWAAQLSQQLGDNLPVEAMAGYNTTIADAGVKVNHPLLHHNGGFVITPMEMGLRVGGTLELGGLDSEPDFNRARTIVSKAKKILPNLSGHNKTEWVGYRPMMPDTLPVIDYSHRVRNVVYACGHGQLGITYGAITGELVADLVQGANSKLDLSYYRSDRF
ncbi:FAD-binding oxidoreductase [Maribrevibacterium harenarium]|uniref:FAD-binding oxidoreductase n=1 Tax=Maribrevibacterium harenarium TaxID=2589817 RepID=A0A501WIZ6_9GAMM|nr:FAD-binding oxidoreductase [Maribrevibacterium harenarium]TPE49469.1 FAD-binding oxidoreductase [Maribrevibacterium harenarium]